MKRLIQNKNQLFGLMTLIAEYVEKHGKAMVSVKSAPKTLNQLGYLHAEMLPKLTIALFDSGEIKVKSENAAKLWLKMASNYGEWFEIGGKPLFDPYSFSDADIETLTSIMDTAIWESSQRQVFIAPPRSSNA